jgi:hypothetical protein
MRTVWSLLGLMAVSAHWDSQAPGNSLQPSDDAQLDRKFEALTTDTVHRMANVPVIAPRLHNFTDDSYDDKCCGKRKGTKVVIIKSGRTGSSWLVGMLERHCCSTIWGQETCEHVDAKDLEKQGIVPKRSVVEDLELGLGCEGNQMCGITVNPLRVRSVSESKFVQDLKEKVRQHDAKVILLTRNNALELALSKEKIRIIQENVKSYCPHGGNPFSSSGTGCTNIPKEMHYDPAEMANIMAHYSRERIFLRDIAATVSMHDYLHVTFEDMKKANGVPKAVFDFIGLKPQHLIQENSAVSPSRKYHEIANLGQLLKELPKYLPAEFLPDLKAIGLSDHEIRLESIKAQDRNLTLNFGPAVMPDQL